MVKIIKPVKCLRPKCGHEWYPRKPGLPARCAKCKSPYYNRPQVVR